jgi:aryl-alcohol dehydrogenase-like predicted oxidoreductase
MGLAGTYGRVDRAVAEHTLMAALDNGVRLYDAAPLYGDGLAEEFLGATLAGQPIAISTKFGLSAAADGRLIRDSRPATVRASVESSLRRLRRDRVDVLLQHRPDPNVSDHDVAEVLLRLVEEGKTAHIGLSHAREPRTRRFQAHAPIKFVQNEMSAAVMPGDGEGVSDFASLGVVFMAHSPLARGILAGRVPRRFEADDYRSQMPDHDAANQAETIRRAKARGVGDGHSSPVAEALNWVLAQGRSVIAVVGARSPEQVQEFVLRRS